MKSQVASVLTSDVSIVSVLVVQTIAIKQKPILKYHLKVQDRDVCYKICLNVSDCLWYYNISRLSKSHWHICFYGYYLISVRAQTS